MALVGQIHTRSGHRFTSPTDVLSIDVEAFGVGGETLSRVGFVITPEVGAASSEEEWTPALRFPNFSSNSPLPGVPAGGMAPLFCYGITMTASEWPTGWIQVRPYLVSGGGPSPRVDLDPIWILNDRDGVDRTGSSSPTVYCDGDIGNDANSGFPGDPVRTFKRAIELCRRVPGGSIESLTDMNCGGARIVASGTFDGIWIGGGSYFHTGREWITIEAANSSTRINWTNSTNDYIQCNGVLGEGSTAQVKLVGFDLRSTIQLQPPWNGTVTINGWLDRCTMHSPWWDPAKRWTVRYRERAMSWIYWIPSGTAPAGETFFSCCTIEGALDGITGCRAATDVRIKDFTAIATFENGSEPSVYITNALTEGQRYWSPEVWGAVLAIGDGNFNVSVPTPGTLRIDLPVPVYQIGHPGEEIHLERLTEIIGTDFRLNLTDFGGGNDGLHAVTAAGPRFVELSVPGATVTVPQLNAKIETWLTSSIWGVPSPGSYAQYVHPDILWLGSLNDSIFSNLASRDIQAAQGLFGSTAPKQRCVFFNLNDGGFNLASPVGGSSWSECVMAFCSFSGAVSFSPNTTNSKIAHNQWRSVSDLPADGNSGNYVNTNHTTAGPAQGTNGSSGPFFKYDTEVDPWWFEAISPWNSIDYGVAFETPAYYWWPGAETFPIGVLSNVGLYDWGSPSSSVTLSAEGGSSFSAAANTNTAASFQPVGSASLSVSASKKHGAFLIWFCDGIAAFNAGLINGVFASLSLSGSASISSSSQRLRRATLQAVGSGTLTANPYNPGSVEASLTVQGEAWMLLSATRIINAAGLNIVELRELMKQRIHNALVALIRTGAFYPCRVDATTGRMTVDTSKTISPTSVVIKETRTSYRPATQYRRSFNVSEMQSWTWIARVSFNQEVACEVFEESAISGGIQIAPVEGLDNQRTLLARLADSDYTHGPEQSPSRGTTVDFIFEVIPETLRK